MGRGTGSSVVSALLIAVAFTLFVPALYEAAAGVPVGLSPFGGQLGLVLETIPLLVAAGALLVLVFAMTAAYDKR